MRHPQICVTGSSPQPQRQAELAALAKRVGIAIAEQGGVLVIGGSKNPDHLPNSAHAGVVERGGRSLVIVEGVQRDLFNESNTIVLPSGMVDGAWEALIGSSSDAIIVIGGRAGTLVEMLTAYKTNAHIIALQGTGGMADAFIGKALDTRERTRVVAASSPEDAVTKAMELARR